MQQSSDFFTMAGTSSWGLWFGRKKKNQVHVTGFTNANQTGFNDVDFARDADARKSTNGVVFFLADSPISWQSMKQMVVAQSTCEA